MAEDHGALPFTQDQLDELKRALREGAVRTPDTAPSPSEVLTGRDARVLRDTVQDIVRGQTALFLPGEEIRKMIREELNDGFGRVGLRVDPEHVEETGNALRNIMKWNKRIEVAGNTIIGGLILTLFYALAKLVGIKLPTPPGLGG